MDPEHSALIPRSLALVEGRHPVKDSRAFGCERIGLSEICTRATITATTTAVTDSSMEVAMDALQDLVAELAAQDRVEDIEGRFAHEAPAAVMRWLSQHGWDRDDERLRLIGIACLNEPTEPRLQNCVRSLHSAIADLLTRSLVSCSQKPRLPAQDAEPLAAMLAAAILTPGPVGDVLLDVCASGGGRAELPVPPVATARGIDVDRRVTEVERTLNDLPATDERALQAAIELFTLGPGSTWVFGRLRRRAELLLREPTLRSTELGMRVWAAAAGMLSMADADRALADEAASVTLRTQVLGASPEALGGGLRSAWLLVRLDRFEEALEELERWRAVARAAAMDDHAAVMDAVEAHLRCSLGPLDLAVSVGTRAAAAARPTAVAGLARSWGSSSVIRAHLLAGEPAAAELVSRTAPSADERLDLGGIMLLLARGLLAVERDRPAVALRALVRVREHHRRVGVENLAGWPWLEAMVVSLHALNRSREAHALIEEVQPSVLAWGTPTLVAELHRARAVVATSLGERNRELAEVARLLAESPAVIDRSRTAPARRAGNAAGALGELTPRVREVAELAASGLSNAQIGMELGIASATVARHMSAALRATGAQNRTELARRLHEEVSHDQKPTT